MPRGTAECKVHVHRDGDVVEAVVPQSNPAVADTFELQVTQQHFQLKLPPPPGMPHCTTFCILPLQCVAITDAAAISGCMIFLVLDEFKVFVSIQIHSNSVFLSDLDSCATLGLGHL